MLSYFHLNDMKLINEIDLGMSPCSVSTNAPGKPGFGGPESVCSLSPSHTDLYPLGTLPAH